MPGIATSERPAERAIRHVMETSHAAAKYIARPSTSFCQKLTHYSPGTALHFSARRNALREKLSWEEPALPAAR